MFCNVNLGNLGNVLQNLRTSKATERIFRASGSTNLENLPDLRQPWWHLREFDICIVLPKKALDTSLPTTKKRLCRVCFFLYYKSFSGQLNLGKNSGLLFSYFPDKFLADLISNNSTKN